jgi:RNA polymerase subunit RPABC4/transcription elongation factor Spt4
VSKITFRAEEDLIRELESFDASKSEVMRDALREHLDATGSERPQTDRKRPQEGDSSLDDLLSERVDTLLEERLSASFTPTEAPDVNVNITLEDGNADSVEVSNKEPTERKTAREEPARAPEASRKTCRGCGENLDAEHVYCPNCGENTNKSFCECGEELRSDWAFCPACGARTPAADVLE